MEKINQHKKISILKKPYTVWIIDDLFPIETPRKINEEWPEATDPRWFRGYQKIGEEKNLLEGGDKIAISNYKEMPPFTQEVLKFFHSPEFTSYLSEVTGIPGLLPDETLHWSGMRGMLPGSWQLIHSDARKHPVTKQRKELTVLYYLNEGYNRTRDEGCLELWNDDMTMCIEKVEPRFNRLVIFQCTDTSYHGVPIVKGERRFITFSPVSSQEGTERYKALFVPRPEDPDFITELGKNRSLLY